MKLKTLHLGLIKTNCYLLETEKAAVVIDPGFERDATLEFLKENEGKERLILLTHAHFDHMGGAEKLRNETGAKIGIGALDEPALRDAEFNLSDRFRAGVKPFSADLTFNDGDTITVGDITFKVIFTPGHTLGGVCYLCGDKLFSGDTLFEGSVGRSDFKGGDQNALIKSARSLMLLPPDTKVYPGHGDSSTIAREKEFNMFVW